MVLVVVFVEEVVVDVWFDDVFVFWEFFVVCFIDLWKVWVDDFGGCCGYEVCDVVVVEVWDLICFCLFGVGM